MRNLLEKDIHGNIGTEKYKCTIAWRNGTIISDEPETLGGKDLGPDAYTLLLSSLAACTLATLRMYIDRKGWDIAAIDVNVNGTQTTIDGKLITTLDRDVKFLSPVTEEQRIRLNEIAEHCPISKMLTGEINIRTFTYSDADTEKKITYPNSDGAVVWKPELCRHSARCVGGLPEVFNTQAKPWINANGATTEQIVNQVNKCPTGALSFARKSN